MAMDAKELASKILNDSLGSPTDKDGKPISVTKEMQEYAAGFIAAMKAGTFLNAPGTIVGVTSAGSPLSAGLGLNGIFATTPAPWIAKTAKGFSPVGPDLAKEHAAVIAYVMTNFITFAPGKITGTTTNTAESPGILNAGAGSDGKFLTVNGALCMGAVIAAGVGSGPMMIKHYAVMMQYVLEKAVGTYASGSVVGVAPSGGGPLIAGAGAGGTIV